MKGQGVVAAIAQRVVADMDHFVQPQVAVAVADIAGSGHGAISMCISTSYFSSTSRSMGLAVIQSRLTYPLSTLAINGV